MMKNSRGASTIGDAGVAAWRMPTAEPRRAPGNHFEMSSDQIIEPQALFAVPIKTPKPRAICHRLWAVPMMRKPSVLHKMPARSTGRVPRRSASDPTRGCITPHTTIARENGSAAAPRAQWNSAMKAGIKRLYEENENEVKKAHSTAQTSIVKREPLSLVAVSSSWQTPHHRLARPSRGRGQYNTPAALDKETGGWRRRAIYRPSCRPGGSCTK